MLYRYAVRPDYECNRAIYKLIDNKVLKTDLIIKTGNSVFDNLPDSLQKIFHLHSKEIDFPTVNETIYKNEDAIKFLYFPIDCILSTVAVMEDGATVEISLAGNTNLVGSSSLFFSPISHFWTSVLIPGRAIKFECGILLDILKNHPLANYYLMNSYLSTLTQISQRAVCNGKHNLIQRFCTWLLIILDQNKTNILALTHDQIAQKLGARRAGITSVAGNLQAEKAIVYTRGLIHILNRQLIESRACECYRILKDKI